MNHHDRQMFEGRRRILGGLGGFGIAAFSGLLPSRAAEAGTVALPFENGDRTVTSVFPQKSNVMLLRTRPPLLETPFEVFDQAVLTPNDRFYVRWHLANIPTSIDPGRFRLEIRGHVNKPVSLTLDQIVGKFERSEIVAVNQCSGNSRGFFNPRVPGGQWGNGAMGNARWTGVSLKHLLEYAGVRANSVQVRFKGLDTGAIPATPDFMKSLAIDHALDGEVMVAYAMNGEPLPLLNGYPLRLVVPGWYATYWVKMLSDIEVLDQPDDSFWTKKAYLIPDTPFANVRPGEKDFKLVPISTMLPRSFFTSVRSGATVSVGETMPLRGIAFGGFHGLKRVLFSADGGKTWTEATLGRDYGKYGFRQWQATVSFPRAGRQVLMVRAVDTSGQMQPAIANWNGAGFMRNVIESIEVNVA